MGGIDPHFLLSAKIRASVTTAPMIKGMIRIRVGMLMVGKDKKKRGELLRLKIKKDE